MLETELKALITEEIYEKIKAEFDWDWIREQVNHYYTDADGVLRKNRVMVRIRVKDGVSKLQVKLRKNDGGPLQVCEETEYDFDGVPQSIPSETAKTVTGIDTGDLFRMGCSATLRHSLILDNTEICLDKTQYFDTTDYEIELEYVDKINQQLLDRLSELGVEFKEKSIGKFSRFIKKYTEANENNKGGYSS